MNKNNKHLASTTAIVNYAKQFKEKAKKDKNILMIVMRRFKNWGFEESDNSDNIVVYKPSQAHSGSLKGAKENILGFWESKLKGSCDGW